MLEYFLRVATVQVCSTTVHPSYSTSPSPQNDLSVLRLCEPVTFSRNIAPACLPSSETNNYDSVPVRVVTTGQEVVVANK